MCEWGLFGLVAVAICGVNVRLVGRGILPSFVCFARDFKLASSCLISIVAFVMVMVFCRMVVGWVDVAPAAACVCDKVSIFSLECTGHAGCCVFLYLSSLLRNNICGLAVKCVLLSLSVLLLGIRCWVGLRSPFLSILGVCVVVESAVRADFNGQASAAGLFSPKLAAPVI